VKEKHLMRVTLILPMFFFFKYNVAIYFFSYSCNGMRGRMRCSWILGDKSKWDGL